VPIAIQLVGWWFNFKWLSISEVWNYVLTELLSYFLCAEVQRYGIPDSYERYKLQCAPFSVVRYLCFHGNQELLLQTFFFWKLISMHFLYNCLNCNVVIMMHCLLFLTVLKFTFSLLTWYKLWTTFTVNSTRTMLYLKFCTLYAWMTLLPNLLISQSYSFGE
jgi:hypothetical protein